MPQRSRTFGTTLLVGVLLACAFVFLDDVARYATPDDGQVIAKSADTDSGADATAQSDFATTPDQPWHLLNATGFESSRRIHDDLVRVRIASRALVPVRVECFLALRRYRSLSPDEEPPSRLV
jgi:hypothetical protein